MFHVQKNKCGWNTHYGCIKYTQKAVHFRCKLHQNYTQSGIHFGCSLGVVWVQFGCSFAVVCSSHGGRTERFWSEHLRYCSLENVSVRPTVREHTTAKLHPNCTKTTPKHHPNYTQTAPKVDSTCGVVVVQFAPKLHHVRNRFVYFNPFWLPDTA